MCSPPGINSKETLWGKQLPQKPEMRLLPRHQRCAIILPEKEEDKPQRITHGNRGDQKSWRRSHHTELTSTRHTLGNHIFRRPQFDFSLDQRYAIMLPKEGEDQSQRIIDEGRGDQGEEELTMKFGSEDESGMCSSRKSTTHTLGRPEPIWLSHRPDILSTESEDQPQIFIHEDSSGQEDEKDSTMQFGFEGEFDSASISSADDSQHYNNMSRKKLTTSTRHSGLPRASIMTNFVEESLSTSTSHTLGKPEPIKLFHGLEKCKLCFRQKAKTIPRISYLKIKTIKKMKQIFSVRFLCRKMTRNFM